MAAHFTKTLATRLKLIKISTRSLSFSARRCMLSEAYKCQDAWTQRLNSDYLQKVDLNDFAVDLRSKFDKSKAMLVDMNVLANKLHEMEKGDALYMEDLIRKYRQSSVSVPVNDCIVYAIVRAYLDLGIADRLIDLMKNKSMYGIFPNPHAVNLIMDHFIKNKDYNASSQIAYEMMLQDDFSHPITYLLSLHSCVNHYNDISLDPPPEPEVNPDEEEDWIPVGIIRYIVYDDHFDIKDERFLMGKTLYTLGRNCAEDSILSQSLQFLGLGLYQKFEKGMNLLEKWAESKDNTLVAEEAVLKFEESLEKAETRNPEEPPKDLGLRTMADAVREFRITNEEKQDYITRFKKLKSELSNRIKEDSLETRVETLVKNVSKYEETDIKTQTELFSIWIEDRDRQIKQQIWEYKRQEKEKEIETKLKEIQTKEEMLRFFENRDRIILSKRGIRPEVGEQEELDIDTIQAIRKKRRQFRT
ncbi:hypothetical protein LOTGIDRAFT_149768 [Lottia gigantea]|uniref:28S ribosomal protein S27, mitochondrial n=1 Tax=Lottia gigantea TaxID=225164 RepID=V4AZN7_LOTGI|nr:hypothetical protein LOTGIDRAFT_149768 [Lottia gigantea]ESP00601.1 hypothetical protein LOTGIDRAFT_149768 [Lottia gigantea]